jgi:hypothetical protein
MEERMERTKARRAGRNFLRMALVMGWISAGISPALAATVDQVVKAEVKTDVAASGSQARIDKIVEETDDLAAKYRQTLDEVKALRVYNAQVETLIQAQVDEMASLGEQISGVTGVGRQIMPLMVRMIDSLDQFVALDMPFLPEERRERVENLRELMSRADVTVSEKFRLLMEAYQIENAYGRSIEAYTGDLELNGATRTVDFLQVGRVALVYQTSDRSETGFWDRDANTWQQLDDSYRTPIANAIKVARKQTAPELLQIPVPAAVEAR